MFKKILVPYDGSELAAKAFPTVMELAKAFNAKVTLVHVCYVEAVGEATPGVIATAPAAEKKVCEAFLSKAGKEFQDQGITTEWLCLDGVPAREIIAYADKEKMDLIAMATHGKGEVAWVLGSTAERVVSHAPVPVLLIRVMEFKPPLLKEEYFL